MALEQALEYDGVCRGGGVPFIYGKTAGVFGQAFCDFGDAFVITDTDGTRPVSFILHLAVLMSVLKFHRSARRSRSASCETRHMHNSGQGNAVLRSMASCCKWRSPQA